MTKQRILPFFIPMEGCPQKCIFCDQVAISGEEHSPTAEQIEAELNDFIPDVNAEVAFYGGSFTCLDRDKQLYYLSAAQKALTEKRIGGIRISTRPDAIDKSICDFLIEHGVRTVELGVQSFDDKVLTATRRGYTPEQARIACMHIVDSRMRLGVQLMTGLPEDAPYLDVQAVYESHELGAELLRIYPTLVLANTHLATMYEEGKYQPQTLDQAVKCCRDMAIAACACSLNIIRMGINPSTDVEKALIDGPYHPAFGGLVKEAIKKAQIDHLLADYDTSIPAALFFSKVDQPLVFGHARAAMIKFARAYPALAFIPDDKLDRGVIRLAYDDVSKVISEAEFCRIAAAK